MELQSDEDLYHRHHHRRDNNSDIELIAGGGDRVPHSGPLSKRVGRRSSSKLMNNNNESVMVLGSDDVITSTTSTSSSSSQLQQDSNDNGRDDYVEVTMDIHGGSVALHSVKDASGNDLNEDEKLVLLGKGMEKKRSFGATVVRNASIKMKQVSQELKRLASISSKQTPSDAPARRGHYDRSKSAASSALKGLKFIAKGDGGGGGGGAGWNEVEKQFDVLTASTDGWLHRSLFGKCIGMSKESEAFAGVLFDSLARRRDIHGDSINKAQLKDFWDQISDQSFDSRLRTFFDMVDKDADGRITEEEIKEIISLSATTNKLSNIQHQAEEYAALIMEELDPEETGFIMLDSLEMLLLHGPTHSTRGDSKYLSQMLSLKLKPTYEDSAIRRCYKNTKYFIEDNWQRAWVMALWICVMVGLFAYKFIHYRRRKDLFHVMGYCVCMAKGAAETLKLNLAIILLPVCRNTITWLRNKTKLGIMVPFDDNLNFHKVIAVAIAIGVGIHAIFHLSCDFPNLLHASPQKYEPMVQRDRVKLPKPLNKLTGFNAFWYSHHLFVIVYASLIVHGIKLFTVKKFHERTTWMYLAIPMTIYALERLTRALRSSIKPVKILKVAVYPGNVLALHMSKPQGFRYKSGQYMFVNCAAVSPFEWHPFSITSAPEDNYLSVHIRTLGDWTRSLRTKFSQVCQPPNNGKSGLLRAECMPGDSSPSNFPKVLIDGPYGAPAQDYKQYEVVLLVGLGIGATPMISILKDIVNNYKAMDEDELGSTMEEGGVASRGLSENKSPKRRGNLVNFKTGRAYFYWVTREQGSFDWFKGVMNEVADADHRGVIELHNYCTSVYEEGDARSTLIEMLQSLNHAKNGVDIVSGTRIKSHFAKPNWRSVYKRIALNHPHARIGVFYCGPPALTKELRQL
ncbi:hypothetical protein PIB30_067948, partial [Stylosanthes scabra]|nr:hypothetical protein [Stylosanthes scabra]